MKKWDIHRKNKIRLYKTLIRTVLAYGYDTWSLSKKFEKCHKHLWKEDTNTNIWTSGRK
jgi:hypothetical protein